MKVALFFILFTPLFANALCQHNQDGMIFCNDQNKNQFKIFQNVLEWWAANPKQIREAKCNQPEKISDEQMNAFIQKNQMGQTRTVNLHGMKITDDSHLIDLLETLTTFGNFYTSEKDKEENQKKFEIPSDCHTVKCAASHIFGKELGIRFLYALDKYQMNMSEYTEINLDRFKVEEVDLILEAMDDLPETLFPFNTNRPLKHFKRGYGPSEDTVANARIHIFSPWDYESDENKMLTIIHEIGHNIGHHFEIDKSKEWLDFSGWVNKDDVWTASKPEAIVSKYAKTNPAEDFAETIVAYRYNPANLKKRSPEKYDFIKKYVFQGIEYDSEENCALENAKIYSLLEKLPSHNSEPKKYDECNNEFAKFFTGESVSFKACLEKQHLKEEFTKLLKTNPQTKDDPKLQKLYLSSAKTLGAKIAEVTKEEEIKAQTKLMESMINSFKKNFNTILGCDRAFESGWQNFITANQEILGEPYPQQRLLSDQKSGEISRDVCLKIGKRRTANCEDLAEFFVPMLSSDNGNILLTTDSQNNCVLKKPSNSKELEQALKIMQK